MKKFIVIILLFMVCSCYHPNTKQVMNDLKVINGKWESYKGVVFNENWKNVNENLFKGEGYSLNGSDTLFFESLSIIKRNDSIFYSVNLVSKNKSVDFLLKIDEAKKNSWMFINEKNDYPSIIKYELKDDSILFVTTSNIRGNKEQFFYLKKRK